MLHDLRYALRQLTKSPAFTFIALVTLSVGIGSAAVVFSAINALLFKPLPHISRATEERLLYFSETNIAHNDDDLAINYLDFLDLRNRMTSLEGIWVHSDRTVILTGQSEPERLLGTEISFDAFQHMGVQPILGRGFRAEDAAPGAPEVTLLAYELWQRRFGGDRSVVDTVVTLNNAPVTIIGVMPKGWGYPDLTELWTPLRPEPGKPVQRGYYHLSGRAKLKPGATLEQTQAEADTIMAGLAKEYPMPNDGIGAKFRPIREEAVEDSKHLTLLLFGAVTFVFLIACVNVANLLLARAVTRSKEFAIRLALGAERRRLVRQLVTESLVLGLAGGAGGLLVGLWGVDAMVAALPLELPFWLRFDLDGTVFVFVCALSLTAALVFGLVPALKSTQPDVNTELKEGGRTCDDCGPRTNRLRSVLVVAEVALALVLLVGAGLMMRSFLHLRSIDPGFESANVMTFRVGFPPSMTATDAEAPRRFFEALLPRLAALPGVESAAVTSTLPGIGGETNAIIFEGRPAPVRASEVQYAHMRITGGSYFPTMRIPLLAGRLFDPAQDRAGKPHVTIVDETFARTHFGGPEQALGRRFRLFEPNQIDGKTPEWMEIVGVVGAIRHDLQKDELKPTAYFPHEQDHANFMSVVLRTHNAPESVITAARAEVLAVNKDMPIYYERTLDDVILRTDGVWQRQFFSYLFTVFGAVALFLACIGIYGVTAYNVSQRTQEIGVRMALGAQPGEVIRMVIRRGITLVTWGLGTGFVAAFLLANLLAGVLYGVSPHDPPTFAAVPALLGFVALLACYLPSRRATRIAPVIAMRGA
ncbi:MAG TPA: ABC transporter permease [Opitutaceae bacterium]